jgi:hypothetical protein
MRLSDAVHLNPFSLTMNRSALYGSANACFGLLVLGGSILSDTAGSIHPAYLLLLFALCSAPILLLRDLNGRYALLGLFGFVYFVFYGALDLAHLLISPTAEPASAEFIGTDEWVILSGAVLAQLGYLLACRAARPGNSLEYARDWSEFSLVFGGALIWVLSTWISWQFRVYVLVDNTLETVSKNFGAMSGLQLDAFMMAGYLQPMGIVILAYAFARFRKPYVLIVLLAALAVEMVMGFVTDSKGQVLIGVIIVSITKALVDGKLPKAWLGGAAAVILLVFPVLQANRIAMGERGTDHSQAVQDIGATIARALATEESTSSGRYHSESFIERTSMKHSVTMIVSETGNGVEFQHGHTLSPLLTAFIPRSIWPDKPDVPTGRLVNKEFHVSEQVETNISPSHLGELYWNFGWPGVFIGMPLIGALLGFIAARFDLTRAVTLTRILVLIGTIKLLVLGFESVINVQYSVWMRTMVAIGLLHLVFARSRIAVRTDSPREPVIPEPAPEPGVARYPNLMA